MAVVSGLAVVQSKHVVVSSVILGIRRAETARQAGFRLDLASKTDGISTSS